MQPEQGIYYPFKTIYLAALHATVSYLFPRIFHTKCMSFFYFPFLNVGKYSRLKTRPIFPTAILRNVGRWGGTPWWPWRTSPSATPASSRTSAPSLGSLRSWWTNWSATGRTWGRPRPTCSGTWRGRRTSPPSPSCPSPRWCTCCYWRPCRWAHGPWWRPRWGRQWSRTGRTSPRWKWSCPRSGTCPLTARRTRATSAARRRPWSSWSSCCGVSPRLSWRMGEEYSGTFHPSLLHVNRGRTSGRKTFILWFKYLW